jgi:hypothetical protein
VPAIIVMTSGTVTARAEQPLPIRHPNLLLNREEIDEVRRKIQTQPWAAALLEKLKAAVDGLEGGKHDAARNAALVYVLTGEKPYADRARKKLLHEAQYNLPRIEKVDLKIDPELGAWYPWAAAAWAYDLTFDTFSPEQRQVVERWLRTGCRVVIEGAKAFTTTPNLVFGKHCNVGLVGYCLGDKELIDWALHDSGGPHGPHRGGFYPVIDTMIKDGYFWGEAPIYALHYDLHGMLALAEAALHYDGSDLYHYVSKQSGGSIKGLLDGYLRLGYPVERTGIAQGSIRMATFGDGSTSYTPDGSLKETWLINPLGRSLAAPVLAGELEIAYRRYRDPGYAWVISLSPERDTYMSYGRSAWGYIALTHGETLPERCSPPAAPSGVYPSQGFAFLRADESPEYWRSGSLAALVMEGQLVGHGHKDYYSLILHGKGRLLYPDLNVIQYEPTHLNWTHEGIAHSTLVVDHQSPTPGPFQTKSEFHAGLKYFAITGSTYKGVRQTRALLMTKQYLADFFQAADTTAPARPRVFDWALHGLGRLYVGNPAAYRPSHALVPFYWWIDNERSRKTDATFQADFVQRSAGVTPPREGFGKEWFEHEVGVRMTMLGVPGTEVFAGDGPLCDGPPYHRIDGNPEGAAPMLVVRREVPATTFAAVHEPYEGTPNIRQVRRLAEDARAIAICVTAPRFTDYLLAAFDDAEHALSSADGQALTFSDFGYLRLAEGQVQGYGKLKGFRARRQATTAADQARINDTKVPLEHAGEFVQWGEVPKPSDPTASEPSPKKEQQPGRAATVPAGDDQPERAAWLHARFAPEEVHLSPGGEKEVQVHLRCVGDGECHGRLRVLAPKGLQVAPAEMAVQSLGEAQQRVVSLRVRAAKDAPREVQPIRLLPEAGLRAASAELLSSVGVVISEDRTLPISAQFVVRAPGYTMKVDHTSGVSFYLLDGDGHRRHGRIHNTNFIQGIPGVEVDGKWVCRFGMPCAFIWPGDNTLTIGCGTPGVYPNIKLRLRYTFHEDRIAIAVIPPTAPKQEQTMWLGNFDALQPPLHNGKQQRADQPIVADRFFFPHPAYRQGLLLSTPPATPLRCRGTAVSFPLRLGQEVVLQFTEQRPADLK